MLKSKFQRINWPVTIRYNVLRAVATGSLIYFFNLLGFRILPIDIPEGLLLIPLAIFVAFPLGIAAWWLELRGYDQVNIVFFVLAIPLLLGDVVLYLANFGVPGLIEEGNHKVATTSAAVIYVEAPPHLDEEDGDDTHSLWHINT